MQGIIKQINVASSALEHRLCNQIEKKKKKKKKEPNVHSYNMKNTPAQCRKSKNNLKKDQKKKKHNSFTENTKRKPLNNFYPLGNCHQFKKAEKSDFKNLPQMPSGLKGYAFGRQLLGRSRTLKASPAHWGSPVRCPCPHRLLQRKMKPFSFKRAKGIRYNQ